MNGFREKALRADETPKVLPKTSKLLGIHKKFHPFHPLTAAFATKLKDLAAKLGPVLGAMSPLSEMISLFFPSGEKQLLKQVLAEMEKQFKIINDRFDKVTSRLTGSLEFRPFSCKEIVKIHT